MQAEQSAVRPKPSMMSKPLSLVKTGPGKEMIVAARNGPPQMQPDTESGSLTEVLSGGGGQARIAGAGGTSPTTNTAVVEVATPGSGASGGSTVEAPAADAQPASTDSDPNTATPPTADANAPAAATTPATTPAADATRTDGTQPGANDKGKESTSKKKKGIKKIIPW
jgi:hypothetical protein